MLRRAFALGLAACTCAGVGVSARAATAPLQAAAERFLRLAQLLRGLPGAERGTALNRWVNQLVDYTPDLSSCGRRDCWQTPAETLASGQGDCEDYAIVKYFLLDACGSAGCARLVYARCERAALVGESPAHVVVIADARAADPLVLDCVGAPPAPLSHRPDLRPVFSFDTHGLWRGVSQEQLGDAAVRLLPWRGVLQRWSQQQHPGLQAS
ncbi:transglutaminase domain-containing protein [Piscinibacter sp. HJYY11]|uniref:transglutaminase domain-containing protein n=1 Tax=Piscinibacter sp. HJYY11 TaxID=2801333 RepID=UPI00191E5501|nr:transglutaminase-like cysteine peptidase [Piscinibacter sp. HJYY11]MBL0729503.1 transglutaminase-like cysteine peptidase [Piscinibacter sp. HJYY11]